jgi:hypothetical protein
LEILEFQVDEVSALDRGPCMTYDWGMQYRVRKSDGTVIGVYDAASEDEVLDKLGVDSKSGYPSRAEAEGAALDGLILFEMVE